MVGVSEPAAEASTGGVVIRQVPFGSPLYDLMVCFREDHLRRPLGLVQTEGDVVGEDRQTHIAAVADGVVLGTVILKPLSPAVVKLRQMAVAPQTRGTGLGRSLVRFAESIAREQEFQEVELASRVVARGFYEALGYAASGDLFVEVGLPHVTMRRRLTP